ncbi:hypothetical protein PENNAL_c0017G11826 [Penicillium nalgiovense]|uniref:Acyl-CoA dehydrogenase/oxidase C-terminal domain-containing protein n=1 Tax=Penicillium nalgiovense TaxID=60175 RepID=A0A1V6YLH8_PENNA|nr:hypothetical protein PENNAL_c0017G11826 [Penicillium nalgiovense]
MESSSASLLLEGIFKHHYGNTTRLEDLELSYARAKAIGKSHSLTLEDVLHLTPKFWKCHQDRIIIRDTTAQILVTIQINLVAGTLAPFVLKRPDLEPLMKEVLNFDITFMPPSMPIAGTRRIAIVMACLIFEGENRGIRPFVVPINDGKQMCKGVHSRLLPSITGGKMLDHALTSFHHVRLPATSMLGELARPANLRDQYLSAIDRLGTGALALSLWIIPFLKCATFIVGSYSQRRTVQQGAKGERAPIISFRTQQLPIMHSLAQIAVMKSFADWLTGVYSNDVSLHPGARRGLGVILKILFIFNGQGSLANLIERSGAQGMYPHNQLAAFEVWSLHGLATELLIGRYKIPEATKPNCLLAQHETGVITELKELHRHIKDHRSAEYNSYILPHCRPMILAIGQRMAYEAAANAGVDPSLLALYEAGAIKSDPSWYVEYQGLSRKAQFEMERKALDGVLPRLDEHLRNLDIEAFCTAPMLSSDRLEGLMGAIPSFTGTAHVDIPVSRDYAPKL